MRADLALVGFGHVGRRFATLLEERRDWLSLDYDLDCRIVGIATARHGCVVAGHGLDAIAAAQRENGDLQVNGAVPAHDSFEVIRHLARSDGSLRVLVETTTLDIGAGQPAIDHVRAALQAGCHVVTANKGPAAFAYEELSALAADRGVSFLFEGAVMDGVPVFNLVRETLPAVDIFGFRGVINSTTNHILSAIEDGESFDTALARMQAEGIAESDPSLDVDGWDAAAKAAALANVLMRAQITPLGVDREGIGQATARLAMAAKGRGARVRLVASAARTPTGVLTSVRPVELPESDMLAGLRGMANALILQTDLLGEIAITQLGGSLTQTAYALLSDLVTVGRRHRRAPSGAAPGRSR
ncbi:MAG: homoserine dehydrogenase [Acidobacteria bacterium]|nr:homoserine dehydrogenase [Acidobacteriota bacterium]